MKMTKSVMTMMVAFTAFLCNAGDSAPFYLDTTDEPLINAPITYNPRWSSTNSTAAVFIYDNGALVKRTAGAGEFVWQPTTLGKHTLTYAISVDGATQDEVYEVDVWFGDWKYSVGNDGATILVTTLTSGDVVIPSEIDGHPVVGIASDVFDNCPGLTSVTIPDSIAGGLGLPPGF